MLSRSLRAVVPLLGLVLFGAGCFSSTPQTAAGPDGGVFRTKTDVFAAKVDVVEWKQLKLLNLGTKFGSIADIGTISAAFDPQDPLTMYLGTAQNGLMYTNDGGESWQSAKGLSVGQIQAIAVDPQQKCVLYVGRDNQIFKTETCGRDWNQVFYDGRLDKKFMALAVDPKNSNVVYAGTSEGDLFRSDNAGATWRATYRVEGIHIMNIAIDPRFGILRSDDAGATWNPLTIAAPNNTLDVRALAVQPKDPKKLVYATNTSIAFSNDGGVTWTNRKLPTTRGTSFVLFDGADKPGLFVGVLTPVQAQ